MTKINLIQLNQNIKKQARGKCMPGLIYDVRQFNLFVQTESHIVHENFMDWQISSLSCQQFSKKMFSRAFWIFYSFLKTTTCFIFKSHQKM